MKKRHLESYKESKSYFLTGGQVASGEWRTGGKLRGFWLTQCAPSGPAQQMSWDMQGGVAGKKLAGSD